MNSIPFPSSGTFRVLREEALQREQRRERFLWSSSFVAVVGITVGLAAWIAYLPRPAVAVAEPPPAAIAMDLAPLPVSTPSPPEDVPVGPPQTQVQPDPAPEDPPKISAPPAPAPHPPVPVPKVEKKPLPKKPTVKPVPHVQKPLPVNQPPAQETTRPPSEEAPPSQTQAAPAAGASSSQSSHETANWQGELLARLEHYKRYPHAAQHNHEEGTSMLHFVMDRKGHVLSARIVHGSGHEMLDQETLALVRRAEPLPAPPDSVPGATIALTVPVEFYVNQDSDPR